MIDFLLKAYGNNSTQTKKKFLPIVLTLVMQDALASGDPRALFLVAGELLLLLIAAGWVAFAARPVRLKIRAACFLMFGLFGMLVIWTIPNYAQHQSLLILISVFILLAAIVGVFRVLR